MKGQLAARCAGVDFFGKRAKRDTAFLEVLNDVDKIAQAAGEAVELPDYQRIAAVEFLEATEQGRAVGGGSGALVLEDVLLIDPGALQGLQLHVGVLVDRRDAGVTVSGIIRGDSEKNTVDVMH